MSRADAPAHPRSRRLLILLLSLLALSLAANLAVGGYLLGQRVAGGDNASHGMLRRGGPAQIEQFLATITPARRAELAAVEQAHRQALRAGMRELRLARRELGSALTAEYFDRQQVLAAMRAVDAALATSSRLHHERLLPFVEALTPDERRAFAQLRHLPRAPRPPKHPGAPAPPPNGPLSDAKRPPEPAP